MRRLNLFFIIVFFSLESFSQSAFYTLGKSYAKDRNYDEAIRLTKQSIKVDEYNPSNLGLDYGALCEYYSSINEPDSCFDYANKALQIGKGLSQEEYQSLLSWVSHYLLQSGFSKQAIACRNERVDYIIHQYGTESPRLIKEYRILSSFYEQIGEKENAIEYAKKEEDLAYKTRNIIDDYNTGISYSDSFLHMQITIQQNDKYSIEGILYIINCLNEHRDAIDEETRSHALTNIWAISRDNDFIEGCLAVYKEETLHGSLEDKLTNLINIYVEDKNIKNDIHAPEYAKDLYNVVIKDNPSKYFKDKDIGYLLLTLQKYYNEIGLTQQSMEIGKKNIEWRLKHNLPLLYCDVLVLISASKLDEEVQYAIKLGNDILESHRYDNDEVVLKYVNECLCEAYSKIGNINSSKKHMAKIGDADDYHSLYAQASQMISMKDIKSVLPIAIKLTEYKDVPWEDRELIINWLMIAARAERNDSILKSHSNEFVNFFKSHLLRDLPLMSEEEQANYLKNNPYTRDITYDYFIGLNDGKVSWAASKEAYDYTLLRKGVLLTSQNEFRNVIKNSPDSVIRSHWKILQQDNRNFSLQAETIKRELINYASQKNSYLKKLSFTWKEVRDALKEDEAAIEFVLCYNFTDNEFDLIDSTYIALILKKDLEAPIPIVLTSKLLLDLNDYDILDSDDLRSLYTQFWFPLEHQIKDIATIYFSPVDILHSIPIEYASNGTERVNERWNVVRVSSTREIIEQPQESPKNNIVLYGGLIYDLNKDTLVSESRSSNYHPTSTTRILPIKSMRDGIEDLPGSLTEVTKIANLFTHQPTLITGKSGTEESFKTLEGSNYDIIHLATHGFFWTNDVANTRGYVNFLNNSNFQELTAEENAMLRSGLLFSGANVGLMGESLPDDVEDGVLTALELSNMNLGNVDMVVMSACESGLGETSGEGVFGLQRGFKLAGANTLLMSLWKVDDTATQLLMTEFYRNYLSGKSKQESLKFAQQYLRNYTEGEEDYSDPKYWAAFILLDALN